MTTHRSPICSCDDGTSTSAPSRRTWATVSLRVLRNVAAWALPRPSAIASAKLANSTVNHRNATTMPANRFSSPVASPKSRMNRIVVSTEPTSTTNITGLRASVRGSSLTNESSAARLTIAGSNSDRAAGGRLRTFGGRSVGVGTGVGSGVRVVVMGS